MSFETKEAQAIERIREILCKLAETCEKIEASDSKVNHFLEQEKAINEIRRLIHEMEKTDRLIENYERHRGRTPGAALTKESKALAEIAGHFDKLEITLGKLQEDGSKVKGYFEQRKALHEVKRVLHYMGKYDQYEEKELEDICC